MVVVVLDIYFRSSESSKRKLTKMFLLEKLIYMLLFNKRYKKLYPTVQQIFIMKNNIVIS